MGSLVVAVALLILFACSGVEGWWCTGHQVTVEIANQLLSIDAREYFAQYVDYNSRRFPWVEMMTELACWPDDMKNYTNNRYNNYHYSSACYRLPGDDTPCPPADELGLLKTVLPQAYTVLANPAMRTPDQAFWFGFLLHLVGDAHQPLHTCTLVSKQFPDSDIGGNNFIVSFNESNTTIKWTNLHSFYDSAAYHFEDQWRPYSQYPESWVYVQRKALDLLENVSISAADVADLDVTSWLAEGLQICGNDVYRAGAITNGTHLSDEYRNQTYHLLRRRLALGGRRLAAILTDIYNDATNVPPAAPPADGISTGTLMMAILVSVAVTSIIGVVVVYRVQIMKGVRRSVPASPWSTTSADGGYENV